MRDIHHVCCYGNYLADVSSQACQNGGKRSKMSKRNQDNGQPQNFDASVLCSVISSIIKKEDNPLSKSAFLSRESNLTLLAPGFFGWCRTGGGGVFHPLLRNSFVFKVRLLKFCTELLWDKMNILR